VGLWLVEELESGQLVGFCGFLEIPTILDEPQLVYALFGRFTGQGYATEMARAAIARARSHAGFETIVAGVDAVNGTSCRVLEKIGFTRTATVQGAFGDMYLYQLDTPRGCRQH
jgi:ribosomal-protein-alanine N-acetyltransferase